jgi:hypothetical protein
MSCYSAAEEITPVCADFVVVEAVLPNRSLATNTLLTGKITGNFSIFGRFGQFWLRKRASYHDLTSKFPTKQNSELIRENRELRSNNRD